jgi:diguanylate cyclase (GGDEF)-like protein/PAS domain S-box-containing protein
MLNLPDNRRVLLVDDTPAIHDDFRKLLCRAPGAAAATELDQLETELFGDRVAHPSDQQQRNLFDLDSAYQGQEALNMVSTALVTGRPYALAFVDMRMPPGWDGVQTVERIWEVDPRVQIVICTAYSDHAWERVLTRLRPGDGLLILKKPFEAVEVFQLANTLSAKWNIARHAEARTVNLENTVAQRARELAQANEALRRELAERQRVQAELAIAASVFHHALDGVVIAGPYSDIISVNPAFTRITGYQPEEVVGRLANQVWERAWGAGGYQEMTRILRDAGRWEGELTVGRKNGQRLLARLSVSPVEERDRPAEKWVCLFHDITELRRKDDRIRHLAFHDHLTGLPNQVLVVDRLTDRVQTAQREGTSAGVFFVDLDQFKAINDSYGHDVGNCLLREVASRLRGCLGADDMVARIGGDEFVVLAGPVDQPDDYGKLARDIIGRLSRPARVSNLDLQVGASVGIACFPGDGSCAIELMKHADAAMYEAKAAGRGTFRFFQPAMSQRIERRLRLEMELRNAVGRGELELRYQPEISLVTGQTLGVEALIRWRHPQHGLLEPGDFLELAEAIGLSAEIQYWVLEEAFRQAREWRCQGLSPGRVAVNISADQVQRCDLIGQIASLAGRYNFPLTDLEIELTENSVMAEPKAVAAILAQLRGLGVRVAIDDFGTGYSSLAYLRRLPLDVLKIDKSFVMDTAEGPVDAEIVRTIVGLGRTLNLAVVAEGVETPDQAQVLRDCGCVAAQGYLFSRPVPGDQLTSWLDQPETLRVGSMISNGAPSGSATEATRP